MKMLRLHLPIATFLCAAAGFVVGFRALPLLSGCTPGANEQALAPFTDYRHEQPGAIHRVTLTDLPEPYLTQYVTILQNPRLVRRAPNGDLFVAESEPGRIRVLRGVGADGKARTVEIYATGLTQPFGIAFYPPGPR